MAALDAEMLLGDVLLTARHADPPTTTVHDARGQNIVRHAAYVVVRARHGRLKGAVRLLGPPGQRR